MLTRLTTEQEALMPGYFNKWAEFAHSIQPINRQTVVATIRKVYQIINRSEPEIQFFPSPYAALLEFAKHEDAYSQFDNAIAIKLNQQIRQFLQQQIDRQIHRELNLSLYKSFNFPSTQNLWNHLWDELRTRDELGELKELGEDWCGNAEPEGDCNGREWAGLAAYYDFCFSVLNFSDGQDQINIKEQLFYGHQRSCISRWDALQAIAKNCDWFFPLEKLCIVSDRPILFALDSEQNLCADGENPAILYADGFGIRLRHKKR